MFNKEALTQKLKAAYRRHPFLFIVGGGALLLMLFFGHTAPAASGGQGQYGQGQYGQGRRDEADNQTGQRDGPVPSGGGYGSSGDTPSGPASGGGDVTSGYWDRQRSQDQSAQAFDNTIRDQNTVRDTGDGTVRTMDNQAADQNIANGTATQVPTDQMPTSYDATPSTAPEAAPASGE
jgi:hypothetical protein